MYNGVFLYYGINLKICGNVDLYIQWIFCLEFDIDCWQNRKWCSCYFLIDKTFSHFGQLCFQIRTDFRVLWPALSILTHFFSLFLSHSIFCTRKHKTKKNKKKKKGNFATKWVDIYCWLGKSRHLLDMTSNLLFVSFCKK